METDLETLKRVLCFLYSDDYQVTSHQDPQAAEKDERVRSPIFKDLSDQEYLQSEEEYPLSEEIPQSEKGDPPPEDEQESSSLDHEHSNISIALEVHAKVYKAADYYDIIPLMTIAAQNFETASKAFQEEDTKDFVRVVDIVYNTLPEHAIRIRVSTRNIIYVHSAPLFEDKDFVSYLSQSPNLVCEVLPFVITLQNQRMQDRQDGFESPSRDIWGDSRVVVKKSAKKAKGHLQVAETKRQHLENVGDCPYCDKVCLISRDIDDNNVSRLQKL